MKVEILQTIIPDLLIIKPDIFSDDRGFFVEFFRKDVWDEAGLAIDCVQINHSGSIQNTVRGLHFQWEPPMGKCMRVLKGEAFLVAVDIRKNSPTFGISFSTSLSDKENTYIWAPAGFARGFCAISKYVEIMYLCSGTYSNKESGILWNDPALGIKWPTQTPLLSEKDKKAQTFRQWCNDPRSDIFQYKKERSKR